MNALLVFTILALVAPGIFGNDNADEKRQDKRGVVNVGGLGGHYPGAIAAPALAGYGAYGAYGGLGHGYLPHAPVYLGNSLGHSALGLGHGIAGHGIAAAVPSIAHGYSAPLAQYSHGYNSAPLIGAPWRLGYNGIHGGGFAPALGHGLGGYLGNPW